MYGVMIRCIERWGSYNCKDGGNNAGIFTKQNQTIKGGGCSRLNYGFGVVARIVMGVEASCRAGVRP